MITTTKVKGDRYHQSSRRKEKIFLTVHLVLKRFIIKTHRDRKQETYSSMKTVSPFYLKMNRIWQSITNCKIYDRALACFRLSFARKTTCFTIGAQNDCEKFAHYKILRFLRSRWNRRMEAILEDNCKQFAEPQEGGKKNWNKPSVVNTQAQHWNALSL